MVERSEQQHRVDASVGVARQVARVRHRRLERRVRLGRGALACLLDVERQHVDELDVVPGSCEARGIDAGAAADVEQAGGGRGQHLCEQLERSHQLEVVAAPEQPVALDAERVVVAECLVDAPILAKNNRPPRGRRPASSGDDLVEKQRARSRRSFPNFKL